MSDNYDTWPEWMLAPEQNNFKMQPVDTRVISEMESGTVMRKEFETDEQIASGTLVLDQIQAAWFEAFEQKRLSQGCQWFYFPLWISGEIQYQLVRMKERTKLAAVGGLYTTYAISLQVAERTLMPDDVVEILLSFSPGQLEAIADRLHVIETVHMPAVTALPEDFRSAFHYRGL